MPRPGDLTPRYESAYEDLGDNQSVSSSRTKLREQGLTLRAIADSVEQETGKHIGFNTVKEVLDREDVYRGGKRGESEQMWPVILA